MRNLLSIGAAILLLVFTTSCETKVLSLSKAEVSQSKEVSIKSDHTNTFSEKYKTKEFTKLGIDEIVLKNIEITSMDGSDIDYIDDVSVFIKTASGSKLIASKNDVSKIGNFIHLEIGVADLNYVLNEGEFEIEVVTNSNKKIKENKEVEIFTEFSIGSDDSYGVASVGF